MVQAALACWRIGSCLLGAGPCVQGQAVRGQTLPSCVTLGSHKPLQDLFPRNPSQAELAYVVVTQVKMRQEQEAYLSRPPTGNSSDKAITAYEAQFTAVSPVGDATSPPFYRQGT